MRRLSFALLTALLLSHTPVVPLFAADAAMRELSFDPPIDAISVSGVSVDLDVSGLDGNAWTPWTHLSLDDGREQNPLTTESNLVMFPHAVSAIRLRGTTLDVTPHPIRVSAAPTTFKVSAMNMVRPRILSRNDWGADDSFLYSNSSSAGSDSCPATDVSGASSQRVRDCQEAQKLYPYEFQVARTVRTDAQGRTFRWPQQYSSSIRMIVVHHTAMEVSNDSRPAVERMRALYAYHANSNGWGDIGYHYVIDENGQIYQGKAGGEYVIGGHAYCNNVGTLGIALMGNFDVEKPTQTQMASLQWLIDTLGKQYNIDLTRNVIYHGQTRPPVVGHRDLLSTDCPGYYAYGVLDQVRANVRSGNLDALVTFPPPPAGAPPPSSSSSAPRECLQLGLW